MAGSDRQPPLLSRSALLEPVRVRLRPHRLESDGRPPGAVSGVLPHRNEPRAGERRASPRNSRPKGHKEES